MFEFCLNLHFTRMFYFSLWVYYYLTIHLINMSYLSIWIYIIIPSCKYVVEYKKNYKPDEFVCWFNNSDLHVRHIHWSIMKQKHMYTITKNSHLCGICNFYIYSTMLTNMKCIGHRLIWNELYQPHAGKKLGLYCDYCNLKPDPITIKLRGYLCL